MPHLPVSYPAKLSSSETGQELIEGTLYCDRCALRFESGETRVGLPWRDLQIHTAGGEEDQVFFSLPSRPDLTLFTEDGEVLNNPVFSQLTRLRRQFKGQEVRRAQFAHFRGLIKFLTVFALLVFLLYLAGGVAVKLAVRTVSPAWERQLGGEILEEFEREHRLIKDSDETARLTALAQRLARGQSGLRHPIEVYVIEAPQPNAFALPGGFILITRGLLELAEPPELAGVLAHEIAHIQQRHGVKTLIQSGGPYYALRVLLGNRGLAGVLGQSSHFLIHQSFSRAHEEEADALAWKYMVEAKMDPGGLIRFLEKMEELEAGAGTLPAIVQTHPPTPQRIQALRQRSEPARR